MQASEISLALCYCLAIDSEKKSGSPLAARRNCTLDDAATPFDRGCAKTQAFIVRVESPSRFRQSENQKFWWRYREKAIKKNHSPHSWLAHVFTQAAP